jgi:hypothetical protein
MEDVLETYKLPYDPRDPQVCMDESSKQLVGEVRPPLDPTPGRVRRRDNEYERKGVCVICSCSSSRCGVGATSG